MKSINFARECKNFGISISYGQLLGTQQPQNDRMKRTFFKDERYEQTVLSTNQHNEVLFFFTAHFLFFNFVAAAQSKLSLFSSPKPNQKKNERVFFPALSITIEYLLTDFNSFSIWIIQQLKIRTYERTIVVHQHL